jgi:hypothetical protein
MVGGLLHFFFFDEGSGILPRPSLAACGGGGTSMYPVQPPTAPLRNAFCELHRWASGKVLHSLARLASRLTLHS